MKKLLSILLLVLGLPLSIGAIQNTVIQTGFNNFQAPTGCGTSGYVLTTDGNCVTSWQTTGAPDVLGTVLTGFSSGAGTVSASDTVLTAFNKVTGNITAITYTAGQFPAVTDGSDAGASKVGVFFSSVAADGGSPSGSYEDVVSFTLPAGDWDVSAIAHIDPSGSSVSDFIIGISTTAGNDGAGLVESVSKETGGAIALIVTNVSIPVVRFNLTTSTAVHCKAFIDWVGGSGSQIRCGLKARSTR